MGFLRLVFLLYTFYDYDFSKKNFLQISVLKEQITNQLKKEYLFFLSENIQIRIHPKNRVDIIVNIYNPNKHDILKKFSDYMGSISHYDKTIKNSILILY